MTRLRTVVPSVLALVSFNSGYGVASTIPRAMSKKYEVVSEKVLSPTGRIVEAFRVAIVEMTCLGERRFDLSGYPHESASEALSEDWAAIGHDGRIAVKKVATELGSENVTKEEAEQKSVSTDE